MRVVAITVAWRLALCHELAQDTLCHDRVPVLLVSSRAGFAPREKSALAHSGAVPGGPLRRVRIILNGKATFAIENYSNGARAP